MSPLGAKLPLQLLRRAVIMATVAVEAVLVAALAAGITVALRKKLIPAGAGIKLRKP